MAHDRVDIGQRAPATYTAMTAFAAEVARFAATAGLGQLLLELVKIRVSQINGCAFCLDMHHRSALELGEDPQRLAVLPAWRETRWFSPRERAALDLAESVTRLPDGPICDEVYTRAAAELDDDQIAGVAWMAVAMNSFNRIAATSGYSAGHDH